MRILCRDYGRENQGSDEIRDAALGAIDDFSWEIENQASRKIQQSMKNCCEF